MGFAGRTYLVTGAQKGIGAAIALALGREGANLVLNYLSSADEAGGVADEIRTAGGDAILVHGDVSIAADVEAMVAAGCAAFGGLDGLVSNAGIFPRTALLDIEGEEWDRVLAVNLKGTFLAVQATARAMIAAGRHGAIVTLSSAAAYRSPMGAHYGASKGAIQSFTRTAAIELAPHHIRVNGIAPGIILTDQPRGYWSDEEIEAVGNHMLLGRVGTVEDVAACALYLLGDESAFVTGQTINVNGGGAVPGMAAGGSR